MGSSQDDLLPFEYDKRFQDDLREIQASDPSRAETIVRRCEAIRGNPFKGEWKSWAMDGLYGLHADPLVILYQLEPDLSPNSDASLVESVYFWRVVHHDKQQTAVSNVNIGDGSDFRAEIRMYYADTPNLQSHVSKLYGSDALHVVEDEYDGEGVTVHCKLPNLNTAEDEIRELIPDAAEVAISRPRISDVLDSE